MKHYINEQILISPYSYLMYNILMFRLKRGLVLSKVHRKFSAMLVSLSINNVMKATNPNLCLHTNINEIYTWWIAGFSPLNWDDVFHKRITPEFAPNAGKSADYDGSDATHFDEEFTNEKAIDSVVSGQLSATMQEQSKFEGFTVSLVSFDFSFIIVFFV